MFYTQTRNRLRQIAAELGPNLLVVLDSFPHFHFLLNRGFNCFFQAFSANLPNHGKMLFRFLFILNNDVCSYCYKNIFWHRIESCISFVVSVLKGHLTLHVRKTSKTAYLDCHVIYVSLPIMGIKKAPNNGAWDVVDKLDR